MIKIGVYRKSQSAEIPQKMTDLSAGFDVFADIESPVVLAPLERTAVPTGLIIDLPNDIEIQVRPRSGLALKKGITLLNTPGTIDPDYRGELKIILINLSNESVEINHGDRIAQLVFSRLTPVQLFESDSHSSTQRGDGGFGHTGK